MREQAANQISVLISAYLDECRYTKQLRPATIKSYGEVLHHFLKMSPQLKNPQDLSPDIVHAFFMNVTIRLQAKGVVVKASTIHSYYTKLILFFRWLERRGLAEAESLSSAISKPRKPVYDDEKSISSTDLSRIVTAITMNNVNQPFYHARDMLIYMLLLYTGVRVGELLALKVSDVNLHGATLFVEGKTSKSRKSRVIPIHPLLLAALKSYLSTSERTQSIHPALLLSRTGKQLSVHGLKHWVRRYVRLSGVAFHAHRFRHTFACNLIRTNIDIASFMRVMGHTSLESTQKYLRSIRSENSRGFINRLKSLAS